MLIYPSKLLPPSWACKKHYTITTYRLHKVNSKDASD